ncbi:MAG TPA: DPP IV N-terminal domain-containing protein, partial [Bacteroidales bacterium]|nr:DPP IV N-terminal domain-containing protein [Bacteroidales bacterium]
MKRILLTGLIIIAGIALQAQPLRGPVREKANYELASRFSAKKINKMVFSTGVRPHWFKTSDLFWYVYKTPEGNNWYVTDPGKGTRTELFDRDKLAAELTRIVKDPFDAQNLPLKDLKIKDDNTFTFYIQSTEMVDKKEDKKEGDENKEGDIKKKGGKEPRLFFFEYAWKTKTLTWLEDEEKEESVPRWANISPNKEYVVFSRNFNLYWMDWENFEKARKDEKDSTIVEHQLTTEGTRDFAFGSGSQDFYADSTELNKRTGVRGLIWSPDSKHFAMIRSDETKVQDLFVVNVLAQPRPKLERYKYEMPGE